MVVLLSASDARPSIVTITNSRGQTIATVDPVTRVRTNRGGRKVQLGFPTEVEGYPKHADDPIRRRPGGHRGPSPMVKIRRKRRKAA